MRVFTQELFDQTISGNTYTWYTPDEYNDLLGAADVLEFAAHVTNVTGSSPQMTVSIEESADGRHWHTIGNVRSGSISSNTVYRGSAGLTNVNLSLVRLKITLSGADHQCRLKLLGMGRVA